MKLKKWQGGASYIVDLLNIKDGVITEGGIYRT